MMQLLGGTQLCLMYIDYHPWMIKEPVQRLKSALSLIFGWKYVYPLG